MMLLQPKDTAQRGAQDAPVSTVIRGANLEVESEGSGPSEMTEPPEITQA